MTASTNTSTSSRSQPWESASHWQKIKENPEYRAILWDILEKPHQNYQRMVMADWLEDNHCPRMAAFIRLQIETEPISWQLDLREEVRNRMRELFPRSGCGHFSDDFPSCLWGGWLWSYDRGFVYEVSMPLHDFQPSLLREMFLASPIISLRLLHLRPAVWLDGAGRQIPSWIPSRLGHLWPILAGDDHESIDHLEYPFEGMAHLELANALVSWGRSLAGLPPFPLPTE